MASWCEVVVTFIAKQLRCVICLEMFRDPVTLVCGHTYCHHCIHNHLNVKRSCPQCRAELREDCKLHRNVTISAILDLHDVGGRGMWARNGTGREEEPTQTCFTTDKIRTNDSSSSSSSSSSPSSVSSSLSSSLDCTGGSQCAENSLSLQSHTQIDEYSECSSEENSASVSEDPDSLRGLSEGGVSAATAVSAEFVSLSFSSWLGHRRLVFLPDRRRLEVRSCSSLRTQLCHFEACQWMAEQEFTTGRHYWDIETSECSGWAVGVAYSHLGRNERLGRSTSSWCIEWSSSRFSAWHDGSETTLKHRHSTQLRVMLDMDSGHLSFWSGTDGEAELYDVQVAFTDPVRPVFWLFGIKPGNALSFPTP